MIKLICKICNKEFWVFPSCIKNNKTKSCSKKCSNIAKKGKPTWNKGKKGVMPIPWNKNLKGIHLSPKSEFKKGQPSPRKGIKSGYTPWNKNKKIQTNTGRTHFKKTPNLINPARYIFRRRKNHPFCNKRGYVLEHRLIIESQIKRYLLPEEKCHHLNGIRNDNRPENLMAFINHSIHIRFHRNPGSVKPEEIIFDGRLRR